MNIGEFKKENGRLMGSVFTRTIDLPRIGLRPVQSQSEKAPIYEIVALNIARRWVQIGALWEAVSKKTGEVFLAGQIDDPSLPEPLPVALFPNEAGGFTVAWRRENLGGGFGGGFGSGGFGTSQRDYAPRTQDGFGDSTAGADGSLTGGQTYEDMDEKIPF
ncbi:hypothetical protein GCM10009087_18970 [Sphingomonas oligophenolica]|uniref:DUF736 domain-containing protein n=1 Tax=Sphingomonas oligophenolica TaxID=301154 RepID=A0ABU9Y394_9SPHN